MAHVGELIGGGVENLDVGGEVSFTPNFGEVVIILVSNIGIVEFVVANSQEIVVEVLENKVRR